MKSKRTGKSFNYNPATCPKHVMQTLGFTEEQTDPSDYLKTQAEVA